MTDAALPSPAVHAWQRPRTPHGLGQPWRLELFHIGMWLFALLVILRLGMLQILDHDTYAALAEGQHTLFRQLYPTRGQILMHDGTDGALVPVAMNQTLSFIYADPRAVKDPAATAKAVGVALGFDQAKIDDLTQRLSKPHDAYEPIQRHVGTDAADALNALKLPGILQTDEDARLYPDPSLGGHVVGFVGSNADGSLSGRYGIEGYFDKVLAGTPGFIRSEKDISGRLLAIGDSSITPAVNGSDVVLTIDRPIQYEACTALRKAIADHQADGGSVVILEPSTGRILAMCGAPDFDPNAYGSVPDVSVFNNPVIFDAYEPGSVFKAITVAAGLDSGAITPASTYDDAGFVKIGKYTIRNAEGGARGTTTMTTALDQSLNLGMIAAMRKMGASVFTDYVKRFGFGQTTGVELDTESPGDISALVGHPNDEIYAATASFGQGVSVTTLQMAAAYAAIADGGILRKPYIVDEIEHPDGTVEREHPTDVRRVVDQRTATVLSAMLVDVVENGLGKRAAVPGYYIAGKTGTAQVASKTHAGYSATDTIGSFAGFGPVEDPKFAMVVRIDHPRDVDWAESTAGPLFGQISSFLLKYMDVPPTRAVKP